MKKFLMCVPFVIGAILSLCFVACNQKTDEQQLLSASSKIAAKPEKLPPRGFETLNQQLAALKIPLGQYAPMACGVSMAWGVGTCSWDVPTQTGTFSFAWSGSADICDVTSAVLNVGITDCPAVKWVSANFDTHYEGTQLYLDFTMTNCQDANAEFYIYEDAVLYFWVLADINATGSCCRKISGVYASGTYTTEL